MIEIENGIIDRLNLENLNKFKIVNIDGYNYTLEDVNNEKIVRNLEFYIEEKLNTNDYIYINERIIRENKILQYGTIYDYQRLNEYEIIIIKTKDKGFFLQRMYG